MSRFRIINNNQNQNMERNILMASIVSDSFLAGIRSIYKPKYIQSDFIRKLLSLSLDYYKNYKEAPSQNVESIFDFEKDRMAEEESTLLEHILIEVSREYDRLQKFNYRFYLDKAREYFRQREVEIRTEKAERLAKRGQVEAAENILKEAKSIPIVSSTAEKIFTLDAIRETKEEYNTEPLFEFPGALGKLIGGLHRDWLVAFLAPPKVGKTQWLMESAYQAVCSRCKTLFVSLEMDRISIRKRFYSRVLRRPSKVPEKKGATVSYPVLTCNNYFSCTLEDKQKDYCSLTTCKAFEPQIKRCVERFRSIKSKTENNKLRAIGTHLNPYLRVICYPAFSATIDQLKGELEILDIEENFIPDVIIIDYADILRPGRDLGNERHNLDRLWKELKGLSVERHCLVMTASQSNRASINKKRIGQVDIAEDIRKVAHVDCFIAIQQDSEEKDQGLKRLSVIAHRHGFFNPNKQAMVLESLDLGQPYLDSFLVKWQEEKKRKNSEK